MVGPRFFASPAACIFVRAVVCRWKHTTVKQKNRRDLTSTIPLFTRSNSPLHTSVLRCHEMSTHDMWSGSILLLCIFPKLTKDRRLTKKKKKNDKTTMRAKKQLSKLYNNNNKNNKRCNNINNNNKKHKKNTTTTITVLFKSRCFRRRKSRDKKTKVPLTTQDHGIKKQVPSAPRSRDKKTSPVSPTITGYNKKRIDIYSTFAVSHVRAARCLNQQPAVAVAVYTQICAQMCAEVALRGN